MQTVHLEKAIWKAVEDYFLLSPNLYVEQYRLDSSVNLNTGKIGEKGPAVVVLRDSGDGMDFHAVAIFQGMCTISSSLSPP